MNVFWKKKIHVFLTLKIRPFHLQFICQTISTLIIPFLNTIQAAVLKEQQSFPWLDKSKPDLMVPLNRFPPLCYGNIQSLVSVSRLLHWEIKSIALLTFDVTFLLKRDNIFLQNVKLPPFLCATFYLINKSTLPWWQKVFEIHIH